MFKPFLAFLILLSSTLSFPATSAAPKPHVIMLQMKIIGIKDGDTVEALYYKLPLTIRLEHIDAPEKKQDFGTKAKQKLSDLTFGKMVTVVSKGKKGNWDRNGRLIAELYTSESLNANKEMVRAGLAWHYEKYSDDPTYGVLQQQARLQKKGLWADKNPKAPWDFRAKK